jgi:hypothetical protein
MDYLPHGTTDIRHIDRASLRLWTNTISSAYYISNGSAATIVLAIGNHRPEHEGSSGLRRTYTFWIS